MNREEAIAKDQQDPLKYLREQFLIPQHNGQDVVYLVGNSLGLQSKSIQKAIEVELAQWQNLGVEAWFEGTKPWIPYLDDLKKPLTKLVGGSETEITVMNSLTVNLQLMLTSFYRPTTQKYKILTEAGAFPSDQYAVESHLNTRGFQLDKALIEVAPKSGKHLLETSQIIDALETNQSTLALVLLSGVNYYNGQVLDIPKITAKANQLGIPIGFDLAHAIGNIPLNLSEWGVDFAVWCSYKYLNAGPGAIAGAFVHQKHHQSALPRLAGWWGYDQATRFKMQPGFVPMQGADGWQLSTPNILAMACHKAALAIYDDIDLKVLRKKSEQLTQYLYDEVSQYPQIQILTPADTQQRGAQLSLLIEENGKKFFERLKANNIWGDWREPNCVRLSPVPLYNSFEDIWRVSEVLKETFDKNL
jgi:kynureninase